MRDEGPNSADLLAWYDQNAREMPWRVPPLAGYLPNPYHIWLSEVMLQQTSVAAVKSYYLIFVTRWPDIFALANAEDSEVMAAWAGLGYYARARNLLKCAREVAYQREGHFPDTVEGLQNLPGIGPYTAGAITAIAFDQRAVVVDANVERVMARVYAVQEPLPDCKNRLRVYAEALTPAQRCGDFAQAVMDLGATLCGKKTDCDPCPWRATCLGHKAGVAAQLPRKRAKSPKPVRSGVVFVARRADGALLIERRPDKGLLGGMLGFPGSNWVEGTPLATPPFAANWQNIGTVQHSFTHFHLHLEVRIAEIDTKDDRFKHIDSNDLPTLMRKVYGLVQK